MKKKHCFNRAVSSKGVFLYIIYDKYYFEYHLGDFGLNCGLVTRVKKIKYFNTPCENRTSNRRIYSHTLCRCAIYVYIK